MMLMTANGDCDNFNLETAKKENRELFHLIDGAARDESEHKNLWVTQPPRKLYRKRNQKIKKNNNNCTYIRMKSTKMKKKNCCEEWNRATLRQLLSVCMIQYILADHYYYYCCFAKRNENNINQRNAERKNHIKYCINHECPENCNRAEPWQNQERKKRKQTWINRSNERKYVYSRNAPHK